MIDKMSKENNLGHVFYFDKDENCINWNKCESVEKQYWTAVFKNISSFFEIIVTENKKNYPNTVIIL